MNAIPTEYKKVMFRSRLEAKWAAFFDLLDWPWEYEPIDLNGYIPDFILTFYEPMLVEVKPVLYEKDFDCYDKIEKSGWGHEALILGAKIFDDGDASSGSACIGRSGERHPDTKGWLWASAVLHRCRCCKKWSFFNDVFIFTCRRSGCYDGDHYLDIADYETGRELFAEASLIVQYNP